MTATFRVSPPSNASGTIASGSIPAMTSSMYRFFSAWKVSPEDEEPGAEEEEEAAEYGEAAEEAAGESPASPPAPARAPVPAAEAPAPRREKTLFSWLRRLFGKE